MKTLTRRLVKGLLVATGLLARGVRRGRPLAGGRGRARASGGRPHSWRRRSAACLPARRRPCGQSGHAGARGSRTAPLLRPDPVGRQRPVLRHLPSPRPRLHGRPRAVDGEGRARPRARARLGDRDQARCPDDLERRFQPPAVLGRPRRRPRRPGRASRSPSEKEMDQKPDELVRELAGIPEYVAALRCGLRRPRWKRRDLRQRHARGGRLRAHARLRSLRFDRYRAGDPSASNPAERRGLTLFRSLKTRCFECHGFPTLANPDFKVIGVPDVPGQEADLGRAEVVGGKPYEHAFKVPTLRNVALTAPYMHNGRFKTLAEVILFYRRAAAAGQGLDPQPRRQDPALSPDHRRAADLVAFLNALTDESRLPDVPGACPRPCRWWHAFGRRGAVVTDPRPRPGPSLRGRARTSGSSRARRSRRRSTARDPATPSRWSRAPITRACSSTSTTSRSGAW